MLFETSIGNLIGNYNKILLVGMSSFVIGFGMFMLTFSKSFFLAITACAIYTLGEIVFFCIAQLICYERGTTKGQTLGIYRMTYATSRVIGPAGGSYFYYHLGSSIVWYLCGIIGLMCLIICNYYKKYDQTADAIFVN